MISGSTTLKPSQSQGHGIPLAATPMPATNEGLMFQAQGDATYYAIELCRHAKNSNWLQVAIFLKKLATVDSSLVKNAFGIVKEFLDILINSQLTIPGPLKVKFYQLLSIYTMVAYHEKAIHHESQKAEWQSLLTTALAWVNTKGHKSDDLPYLHMYRYYLECTKAVVDLTSDTHQIDWFTNAANVLSIVVSQFGLCDSQAKTVATDLFQFAKGYLQDRITESWYKVVCAIGVHQLVIMDKTVPIEPHVILNPPKTQNFAAQTNTRIQELSIAILQIQRVLSEECNKVLLDKHVIYACINALEQVLLRQDANDEVCKILFHGRLDPEQPTKKLIGLEELKGYNKFGHNGSIIRSRIVELAYLLIDKKSTHLLVVYVSQKIIADRKKEEKPDSKVQYILDNKPEYFEEYCVKLQQFYPTHKTQNEESIEQLGLKIGIVDDKVSALQHSGLQSQQALADKLRRLPDYYKTKNKMDLPLGGSVLISTAFIRLTITRYTEVEKKEQVIKKTTPVTSDQQLKVYEKMVEVNDPIKLEQIFDLTESGLLTSQNLLISGGAGIGKSTVCQYIANQWAENKLWPEFKAVFWIPLRNLNERGYPPPKAYSLIDIINKECFQNTLSPEECNKLETVITANPEHFLVLLDGYDEVLPVARNDGYLEPALSSLTKHRFSIVTSRPGQAFGIEVTHRLEITGFTPQDIENYITKFFAQLNDTTNAKKVIDFLKQQPMILGIAHIPLQLAMICQLVSTNELTTTVETQITLSELYHRLKHGLLKEFLTRRQTGSKLTEAELKVATQKSLEESYDDVHKVIEELGYYCILNRKIIFSKDDLIGKVKTIHPKNKDETNGAYEARIIKIVEDYANCGILKFIKESNEYYFIHTTFLEYFAARKIARVFVDEKPTSKPYLDVKAKIQKERNNLRFQITWRFVAGSLAHNIPILKQFFDIIAVSKPWRLKVNDWNYFGKLRLVLQCLGEVTETKELGISSKDLLQPLLDGLRYDEFYITRDTEKSLVMLGTAIPLKIRLAITNGLLVDLAKKGYIIAHLAAYSLGELGAIIPVTMMPSVVNQLLDAFRYNDSDFISTIIPVLGKLGTTIPIDMRTSVVNALLPACRQEDNYVGHRAVNTLGELGTIIPVEMLPSVVNELLLACRGGDREAVYTLEKLGTIIPVEMLPLVINQLLDTFRLGGKVREIAIRVLGKFSTIVPMEMVPLVVNGLLDGLRLDGDLDFKYAIISSLRALSIVTPVEMRANVVKSLLNELQYENTVQEIIVSLRTLSNATPVALMPDVINGCLSVLDSSRECCVRYSAIALLEDLAVMIPVEMRLTVIRGLSATLDGIINKSVKESEGLEGRYTKRINLLKNLAAAIPIEVKPKVINQLLPPNIKIYVAALPEDVIPVEFIPRIVDGLLADLDATGRFTCGCIKKFVVESLENIVNIIPKETMPQLIDKLLAYLHNPKGHGWYVAPKPQVLKLLVKLNTIVPETLRPKLVDGILAVLRDKGETTKKTLVIELVKLYGEKELIKKLIIKCEQYTTSIDADIRKPAIDELRKLLQGIINSEVSSTDVLAHVNSALEFSDNPIFSTWVGESNVRIIFEQCQGLLSELK